jgi:site-specific recombinase XerD
MRNPKTPLESVIQSYLLYCQHLKPRTRQGYAQQLAFFVKWLRANAYDAVLGDVEASVVNQYVMERQRVSPYTAYAASSTLKAFGSWLARIGIRHDRGRSVLAEVRSPRVPQDVRRPLTDPEVEVILKAAKQTRYPERDTALILTALDCGLRLNELRELQIKDVDLAELSLTVRAATSKSNRTRQVRIGRETARALDRYVKDFRDEHPSGSQTVFLGSNGLTMTVGGIGQVFQRIRKRSGIRHFMAHVCRHTWATNYRRRDCGDLYDLKYEGGWSDLKMVGRYAHRGPLSERRRWPSPMDALLRDRKNTGVRASFGKSDSRRLQLVEGESA